METNIPQNAGETGAETRQAGKWGKRLAIGGIAVVALAGVGVAGALSQDSGGERMMRFGMGHGGHGMHMQADQASFRGGGFGMGFGGRGMGRMLDRIDATNEQQDKIEEIMDKVHADMRPVMRGFRDTRDDLAKLLAAETVDREALEKLRSERVAAMDQASRTVTAALAEAAEVLTPEQRKKLVENFEDRGRRGRW